MSCEFCEISKNTIFTRPGDCFLHWHLWCEYIISLTMHLLKTVEKIVDIFSWGKALIQVIFLTVSNQVFSVILQPYFLCYFMTLALGVRWLVCFSLLDANLRRIVFVFLSFLFIHFLVVLNKLIWRN